MTTPSTEIKHWADQTAEQVVATFPERKQFTCAAGISPSGTVHFGNFREVITVDLVVRALKEMGRGVRFIYSWDDYDRLRKTPKNIPSDMSEYIGMPYCFIPDPYDCHENYAEHFERQFEYSLKDVGINPTFIRQNQKYRNCEYADDIKHALLSRDNIRAILDKYKTEQINEGWFPLTVYCEQCKRDFTKIISYDENYSIEYACKCGFKNNVNFKQCGIVKLPWRIDWPMRWNYEGVSFEPGGKEHSTPGGSRTTGAEIIQTVWSQTPPVYLKYDFIILKQGGKMSGSLGNVVSLKEVFDYYQPEIVRWLFAGTRPNAEFFLSLDLGIIQSYEDFDRCERIYFDSNEARDEKESLKQKRIYELSCIRVPENSPLQAGFRHLTNLLQIYENDFAPINEYYKEHIKSELDLERLRVRSRCVWNWLQKYAPLDFKYKVQDEINVNLTESERTALQLLTLRLKENDYNENTLFQEFYNICKQTSIEPKNFFSVVYRVLINREKGPKLAGFILQIGKERIARLLDKI